ncbi:MAG TPA: sigma-70 family RNA polymerase sigma factor [Kofleriaceae bacterium]|nr:sigma-70 family RNA polymerase sigma factor [Kofleriaceae bacterium]
MVARAASAARELDDLTLHRAQRGDHAAFRQLVERYERPVWDLVWRLVAPAGFAARAEDLTQETFLRVYRALHAFDPAGAARLSTWIFTIASRLALNELRAGKAAARAVEIDQALDELIATPPASADVARRQLGEQLAAAVGALPAPARAVLVLSDVFELSHDEIARALDVEPGTVKSRLSRARAAVRAQLARGDVP